METFAKMGSRHKLSDYFFKRFKVELFIGFCYFLAGFAASR